ncbi:MAG: hypothetical protein IJL47_05285 [Lachnospiraceae bacterium]|nr:hypothetical protein [Lachnospiraceae bacterium]
MSKRVKLPKFLNAIIVVILVLYSLFVITRLMGRFLVYVPFSGRIFNIQENDLESLVIRHYGEEVVYSDPAEKQPVIDQLNALRYSVWLPDPKLLLSSGGWEYMFRLYQGESFVDYEFGENFYPRKWLYLSFEKGAD